MPKIYFAKLGRFGNNLIQYFVACIFHIVFGHEIVEYSSMCKDAYEIHDTDPLFEAFREFILSEPGARDFLKTHPFAKKDIILHGFFQKSDLLLLFRKEILALFTESNTDKISHTIRVCDVVKARGVAKEDEIVVHFRLDDYQSDTTSHILHPRVYLSTLRKLSLPLRIVSQKPNSFAEHLYFAIFESLHPTLQQNSLLEDFATLRDSKILFSSNSTLSWCAAFLGHQKRYLPTINSWDNQDLGCIEDSDIQVETSYLSLHDYPKPKFFIPLAGEHIQSLCDRIVLNKEKFIYHTELDKFVPPEKYLFLEDTWTSHQAERVFLYQDIVEESLEKVCKNITGIKLLMIHNGDSTIPLSAFTEFFQRFPEAHVFLQNNIHSHPRIHSLPMGVQNKMWRQRVTLLHYSEDLRINDKHDLAVCSWFGTTHPIRKELRTFLEANPFHGLRLLGKIPPEKYEGYLEKSIFSFCPPGNAYDTHRLWESLFARSMPIVLRDFFIERLHHDFPSLPLVIVDSFFQDSYKEQLEKIAFSKDLTPLPYCCLLEYWKLLFETY